MNRDCRWLPGTADSRRHLDAAIIVGRSSSVRAKRYHIDALPRTLLRDCRALPFEN